ncbi:MAG: right-handed parallel beta-helix repeat-containing protein [Planctomycetota bacterium]
MKPAPMLLLILLAWAVNLCRATPVRAAELVGRPGDNIYSLIARMHPGDELILTQGTYKAGQNHIANMHGSKDAWFVIRAQQNAKVVIENTIHQNSFNLDNCSFFKFQNLEITGQVGGDAFKWTGTCSDMVVDNCYMHDMNGSGINCSSVKHMDRLLVTHCQIAHTGGTGEGMYLGHDDGSGPVCDSIFEYNLICHMFGKPKSGYEGDGIEINEHGTGNIVRNNVIFDTACPCITIENVSGPPTRVENNILWDSRDDREIQVDGDAVVTGNLIMSVHGGMRLGKGVSESGNTVLAPKDITTDALLQRGLDMLKLDPLVHGKVGRAGGGADDPNAAMVAFLKKEHPDTGTDAGAAGAPQDVGTGAAATKAAGSTPVAAPPTFNPTALAKLRSDCIGRIVALSKAHADVALSILIGGDPQEVTVQPSDLKGGLQVKMTYGGTKTLAWDTLAPGLLGDTLLALGNAATDGIAPEDRLLVALCDYVSNRQVDAAEQVGKLSDAAPDLAKQYGARVDGLKP